MNVMEIVSNTGTNGAVIHCLNLSRKLAERGHQVTVVCHSDAWIMQQIGRADHIDVVTSDLHRWPLDELRRMAAIVRERQIDVVHTHMSRAHFFGVLMRWFAWVPSVATAQSRHIQLHWMFNDQVIAVSDATRHYHQYHNLVRRKRISTIPNFVDFPRLLREPKATRQRIREELDVVPSTPLIGLVGNVCARKGALYLAQALPKILAAVPDARIVSVGGHDQPDYVAQVQAEADRIGAGKCILWMGHRDDSRDIMTAFDLLVLPSLEESLPLSLLEAMMARLPLVATTVGGIPECIIDGETGFLVPPADPDALADAIIPLMRDPLMRRRFGEAGYKLACRNFSPEGNLEAIEAVFAKVAPHRRAA